MNTVQPILLNITSPTTLIIVLVVVILLFGSQKIPDLMRSIGQGKREFEKGMRGDGDDDELRKEREREAEVRRRVEEEMKQEEFKRTGKQS